MLIGSIFQPDVPIERELLLAAGRDCQCLKAVDLRVQSCGVEMLTRALSHRYGAHCMPRHGRRPPGLRQRARELKGYDQGTPHTLERGQSKSSASSASMSVEGVNRRTGRELPCSQIASVCSAGW